MNKLLPILLAALLAACGTVKKVESGNHTLGDRLAVSIDGSWNHLDFPGIKPAQIWTMEGITVDELLIYTGIKDGTQMHPENPSASKQKNFVFRSDMPAEAIVAMFEGVLSRENATFKLLKLEPYKFGGRSGFRFEYERIRKIDNVQQLGIGFAAVDKGELFAMIYHAPRLTFFPRHQGRVEAMARAAMIK
jgi:hypothetical protein